MSDKPDDKPAEEQPKRRVGRPAKDWDGLFALWLKSGLPRRDFLKSQGIDPDGGTASRKTSHWNDALAAARDTLTEQHLASMPRPGRGHAEIVDNLVDRTSEQGEAEKHVAGTPKGTSWQLIQRWRNNQAHADWKMADTVRTHIGVILKRALYREEIKDDAGKVTGSDWNTTLKAQDLRQLMLALDGVQRVQRLALGLSTENIGIDGSIESTTPAPETGAKTPETLDMQPTPANLFVVELTKQGKFVRARPRRVS